jgi:hypothetical protein
MQADLYSVFCLMFSFQATWDLVETTKGSGPDDVIRTGKGSKRHGPTDNITQIILNRYIKAPDLQGRFATERPRMTPFRFWEVQHYGPNDSKQQLEVLTLARDENAQARLNAWLADEQARKAARMAAMDAHIIKMRAQWIKEDVPNPNDPWDYRNFTRSEYWFVELKEPLNTEFVLRALDVPDEIEQAGEMWETVKRVGAPVAKKYADRKAHKELDKPAADAFVLPIAKRVGRWIVQRTAEHVNEKFQDWVNDLVEEQLKSYRQHDSTYSPRQFWPPDLDGKYL